jgi:hypothetical protein
MRPSTPSSPPPDSTTPTTRWPRAAAAEISSGSTAGRIECILRLAHGQRDVATEKLCKLAFRVGTPVEDDADRGWEIWCQGTQHLEQRLEPAGGAAEHEEVRTMRS